jgi:hypothetical protein
MTSPNPEGRCWTCHGPVKYRPKSDTYRCASCQETWDQEDLWFPVEEPTPATPPLPLGKSPAAR